MPSEFEFLDKHFYDTEEVYLAAQAARERFGNYPQARTSTVIYNIGWQELTKSIEEAVINYTFGQIFPDARTFAYMGEYHGNPQWNIVVTGLNYVNASVQIVSGVREYQVAAYINGTVVINARVVGNNPPMLGEIIHLEATVGDFVEVVELKS
ncbi:hypothetical protein C4K68_07005 [Pokkaliibacter plantistimulans]|uniref:Uncharacterized protein n=1 Tax=Proteobacteria bacterium 228 TaxID=2083153 RepID=A0A2S5KTV2_9PROT|nr:hypothetical protein [Pokkaliibacter plantistimulans]PPC78143.1 hypothetical protein C4K68_07005 [Pokkaliibacter plantistimulans]